jgi:hypothetical protein
MFRGRTPWLPLGATIAVEVYLLLPEVPIAVGVNSCSSGNPCKHPSFLLDHTHYHSGESLHRERLASGTQAASGQARQGVARACGRPGGLHSGATAAQPHPGRQRCGGRLSPSPSSPGDAAPDPLAGGGTALSAGLRDRHDFLAQLNTVLAPMGYVIRGTKTRSPDRFVLCTDTHSQVEQYGLFELQRVEEAPS